jgi:hypothetical protein
MHELVNGLVDGLPYDCLLTDCIDTSGRIASKVSHIRVTTIYK